MQDISGILRQFDRWQKQAEWVGDVSVEETVSIAANMAEQSLKPSISRFSNGQKETEFLLVNFAQPIFRPLEEA